MTFNALTVSELLDVLDDCVEQLEVRSGEITGEYEDYLVETAKRVLALASHFSPDIHAELLRRHSPSQDGPGTRKPHHTIVEWPGQRYEGVKLIETEVVREFPDVPGAHEGAPFSLVHPAVGARLDEIMKPHDPMNGRMPTGNEVCGLVAMEYDLRSGFIGGVPIGKHLGERIVFSGEVEEAGADEDER